MTAWTALRRAKPGALYLSQELRFRAPVSLGARVRATVTATRVGEQYAVFETRCETTDDGKVVVDGTAMAKLHR